MQAMAFFTSNTLSFVLFFPLAAACLIALIPQAHRRFLYISGVLAVLISGGLALHAGISANLSAPEMQLVEKHHWIPSIGAQYAIGLDGLGALFILILDGIGLLSIVFLHRDGIKKKEIIISILTLLFSGHGVFLSIDLLLLSFFICFGPIPAVFLIQFTTRNQRSNLSMHFFIYNLIGSLLVVIGILSIHVVVSKSIGMYTFDLTKILLSGLPIGAQSWIFWLVLSGLSIRMGLFPFHGWVIDLAEDAAFPGSMFILAGFNKMAIFVMLRLMLPILPDALIQHTPLLMYFALVSTAFAALSAIVQENYNKLVGYSVVHQMGLIAAGVFLANKQGMMGSISLVLSHAFVLAMIMIILDYLYSRIPSVLFLEFGGLIRKIPLFSAGFLILVMTYAGLPGLTFFPGSFQILLGSVTINPIWACIVLIGMLLGAIYSLQLFLRLFAGMESSLVRKSVFSDTVALWLKLIPFLLLIFATGLAPARIANPIQTPVHRIESVFQSRRMLMRSGQPTPAQPMTPGVFRLKPTSMDEK